MANPLKPGETTLTIDGIPEKLKKDCLKLIVDLDIYLKDFVIKWMEIGLKHELQELENKQKTKSQDV